MVSHKTPAEMGMGSDRHLYFGSGLDAGPIGDSSRSVFSEYPWRKYVDGLVLLVSSNDALDGCVEWNDLLGSDRHGDTALSRGISKRPGFAARFSGLAVRLWKSGDRRDVS